MANPQVAISSCLLGEKVRYDGDHQRQALITDKLSPFLEIISLCPEVGCGMPVPRPPIQQIDSSFGVKLQQVAPPHRDYTEPMEKFTFQVTENYPLLSGIICKSKSPSCGLKDSPVFDSKRQIKSLGQGFYIRSLLQRSPFIPVIDEVSLINEALRHQFFSQSFTLHRFRQAISTHSESRFNQLHHEHRWLLLSSCEKQALNLDKLANQISQGEPLHQDYLKLLCKTLSSPFSASQWLKTFEQFMLLQSPMLKASLRIILRTLKLLPIDRQNGKEFLRHTVQMANKMNLNECLQNPWFSPYHMALFEI